MPLTLSGVGLPLQIRFSTPSGVSLGTLFPLPPDPFRHRPRLFDPTPRGPSDSSGVPLQFVPTPLSRIRTGPALVKSKWD